MARFILQRLISLVLTLFVASVVIFGALYLAPGDPATLLAGGHVDARRSSPRSTSSSISTTRSTCATGHWLAGVLHGDFGQSFVYREPVTTLLAPRIGNTLFLVTYARS